MRTPPEKLTPSQVAFMEELTAIQGSMRKYCNAITIGRNGVDDIIQESNRVILEKVDEFTLGTCFRAWVFSIVRFQTMAHFKRIKRGHKLLFSTDLTQTLLDESAETGPEYSKSIEALQECLRELRQRDQELVKKRYSSSSTLLEYSAECGRTVDALKRGLFRIRHRLRICIGRRLALETGDE